MIATFFYYVVSDKPWLGRLDPGGAEAGYEQVAARVEAEMKTVGASWIATTDYRTYAMLRWELKDRIPVIEINPEVTPLSGSASYHWRGTAATTLPALVAALTADAARS